MSLRRFEINVETYCLIIGSQTLYQPWQMIDKPTLPTSFTNVGPTSSQHWQTIFSGNIGYRCMPMVGQLRIAIWKRFCTPILDTWVRILHLVKSFMYRFFFNPAFNAMFWNWNKAINYISQLIRGPECVSHAIIYSIHITQQGGLISCASEAGCQRQMDSKLHALIMWCSAYETTQQ